MAKRTPHPRSSPGPKLRPSHRHEVVLRAISDLRPDPKNPRLHSEKQLDQIARSIEAFGFNVPILIDCENKVIAGHGRLQACQRLGWKEVPTIRLDHLSEAQARAFMIADNRLTEVSTWDDALLAEHLLALSQAELDFSLEATGFDMGEIDFRIEASGEGRAQAPDPADILPDIDERSVVVTRPGDLWLLGPHRLLCGNALEAEAYEALMDHRQADVVFTDPPYNVVIDGNASGLGKVKHREFAMASGEMTEAEFTAFLTQALSHLAANAKEGSIHFVCMDWRHMGELILAGKAAYSELKNLCVWTKDNAGMGSLYRSQHELVFVFKSGSVPHANNVQLGRFGRNRSNVWAYPGANSFARKTEEGNLLALHPTVKPVALVADALLDCSGRGDIVLDAFLGSGTTLVAAEKVGRVCFGLELDPIYVDTAIRRWQAVTGQDAVHAATGRSLNSLAAQGGAHEA